MVEWTYLLQGASSPSSSSSSCSIRGSERVLGLAFLDLFGAPASGVFVALRFPALFSASVRIRSSSALRTSSAKRVALLPPFPVFLPLPVLFSLPSPSSSSLAPLEGAGRPRAPLQASQTVDQTLEWSKEKRRKRMKTLTRPHHYINNKINMRHVPLRDRL